MLKEHAKVFARLMMVADIFIVSAAFFAGYYAANHMSRLYPLKDYMGFLAPFALIWSFLLYFLGMYESFRRKGMDDIMMTIAEIAFIGIGGSGILLYFFKVEFVSRILVFSVFTAAAAALAIEKFAVISFFRYLRREGYNIRNILIIGAGDKVRRLIELAKKHAEWGVKIVGIIGDGEINKGEEIDGFKVLGSLNDLPNIVHNNVVDEAIFVVPYSWLGKIGDAMRFCETEGLKISISVEYFTPRFARIRQTEFRGFPFLTFESAPSKLWHLFLKRLMDILVSGAGLIILSPVFLIIAVAIKMTSEGPVFFRQERSSLNGRKFTLYKFRTMVSDAERRLNDLLLNNEMKGPVFKIENDPRITRVGRFLRKFSLDELPQLWNVFAGDMSLVGPRPPIPSEVGKYDSWHRRRLSMRPGLTCIWQVSGRNKITDFDEWAKLDLEYIDSWSLLLDLKILFKTIPAVLLGIGAK